MVWKYFDIYKRNVFEEGIKILFWSIMGDIRIIFGDVFDFENEFEFLSDLGI